MTLWPDGEPVTPWADPWHDVAGDVRAAWEDWESRLSMARGLYQCPRCFGPSEGPGSCRRCLANPPVTRYSIAQYMTAPSSIVPGNFACVPMHSDIVGPVVRVLEWCNGEGFRNYEHALVFAGYYSDTPTKFVGPADAPIAGTGRGWYVIEAAPNGARWRNIGGPPSLLAGALWSTDAFPLTDESSDAVVAAAIRYLGTPYSWVDYGALTAHRLHLPVPGLQGFIESSHSMICSQLVDRCYMNAGIQLFNDNRWCGYVTPEGLADDITERLALVA